jgi:non-ribosomal peptide synthetase component F
MLERLRLWVCSGETLTVSLAEEFVGYFNTGRHALCNFYGSTEIMGDVSYHVIRTSADINYEGKVPIGKPITN